MHIQGGLLMLGLLQAYLHLGLPLLGRDVSSGLGRGVCEGWLDLDWGIFEIETQEVHLIG
jgi:hypothetical protein